MTQESQCRLELLDTGENTGKFSINGILNFDTVISLNQAAQSKFQNYRNITVDLAGVTYVNSAGLALLLEWKRQATIDKKSMKLQGVPQKLLNIARISEIEKILSL